MAHKLRAWILGAVALLGGQIMVAATAAAHDQPVGYTEVTLPGADKKTCLFRLCIVQITHRYTLHDAEAWLTLDGMARRDLILDLDAQADFARYVAANFALSLEVLPLTLLLVGVEVEAGYVWVYQETIVPRRPATMSVTNRVLMDVKSGQTNRINFRRDRDVRTLVTTRDEPRRTLPHTQVTEPSNRPKENALD